MPLSEEETLRVEGLNSEERKQFAEEKLKELKQPKPVKLADFSVEGMEDREKAEQILEAMQRRRNIRSERPEKCRYPLGNREDSELLREKYEAFFMEYGALLTESYCILHYGEQKGKRYDRLFYSAMNPYGFPLEAHSGEYVESVEYQIHTLRSKIKEKSVLLGHFGWGFKYSPKSDFNPQVVFLGESGTYYAYDGMRTLREKDFAALLAKLFRKELEGVTLATAYEGDLSVSRLDHRLEYCYGEKEFLASVQSGQNMAVDYFTIFGRQPMWTAFEEWMDSVLEQGISEETYELCLNLVPTGRVGCKLELLGYTDGKVTAEDEKYSVEAEPEIYSAKIPELIWKMAVHVYDVEKEVCPAMEWYMEYGRYAEVLKSRGIAVSYGGIGDV